MGGGTRALSGVSSLMQEGGAPKSVFGGCMLSLGNIGTDHKPWLSQGTRPIGGTHLVYPGWAFLVCMDKRWHGGGRKKSPQLSYLSSC